MWLIVLLKQPMTIKAEFYFNHDDTCTIEESKYRINIIIFIVIEKLSGRGRVRGEGRRYRWQRVARPVVARGGGPACPARPARRARAALSPRSAAVPLSLVLHHGLFPLLLQYAFNDRPIT